MSKPNIIAMPKLMVLCTPFTMWRRMIGAGKMTPVGIGQIPGLTWPGNPETGTMRMTPLRRQNPHLLLKTKVVPANLLKKLWLLIGHGLKPRGQVR